MAKEHDKGYKEVLSNKKVFLEIVRTFVRDERVSAIDEQSLEAENVVTNLGIALDEMKKDAEMEGEKHAMLKVARKMLLRNDEIDTICDRTGLSLKDIEDLKKKIKN